MNKFIEFLLEEASYLGFQVEKPEPAASLYLAKPRLYPETSHTKSHHLHFRGPPVRHTTRPVHSTSQPPGVPLFSSTAVPHRCGRHPLQRQQPQLPREIRRDNSPHSSSWAFPEKKSHHRTPFSISWCTLTQISNIQGHQMIGTCATISGITGESARRVTIGLT